jgi:rubrerythrin
MTWWKDPAGYTTDLSLAKVYTQEEAQRQHNARETDIPWPKDYIDGLARPTVDMQKAKKDSLEMVESGILIIKPKFDATKHVYRCVECGGFMNDVQVYVDGCPKCGADNKP